MKRLLAVLVLCGLLAVALPVAGFKGIELEGLQQKAEQGDAEAQAQLGVLYSTGIQTPKNLEEAVKWYRKSADQGHSLGQYNLAFMYIRGEGVKEDLARGRELLQLAADQGFDKAKFDLGYMVLQGLGGEQDQDLGIKMIREAAYAGNRDARDYLQEMGVPLE
ncbi:MAG: tetratricopeptide repeat protein [Desulfuromonadales bacterium]|nr:tetratricopeptide repeat protein [Desulfuromonadales bacterium]